MSPRRTEQQGAWGRRPFTAAKRPTPASTLAKMRERGVDGLSVFELNLVLSSPELRSAENEAVLRQLRRQGAR